MTGPLLKIVGLKALLRKLEPEMLDAAKAKFFTRAGIDWLNKGTVLSPVYKGSKRRKGGRTRGSLKKGAAGNIWRPQGTGGSQGLIIGSKVSHKGTYYPRLLDDGGGYHYASGPFQGQPLAGWFTEKPAQDQSTSVAALGEAREELLKKWGR